jgi:hypothetical protein
MSENQKIWLPCPYLEQDVLLTGERYTHIIGKHPKVFAEGVEDFKAAIAQPDQIRRNPQGSLKFVIDLGTHFLVIALNRLKRDKTWKIATAYDADSLSPEDEVLWKKSP